LEGTLSYTYDAAGHVASIASSNSNGASVKGIRRTIGTAQHGKAALLTEDLRRLAARAPANLLGLRDRALSLVGFAGAFRRSDLAAIDFADLDFRSEGVVVTLRKSKTDQEQAGRPVAIPKGADPETCPVRALQSWLFAAGIVPGAGPVFRAVDRHGNVSDRALFPGSIARILKRAAARAGFAAWPIAGHSLRAGHVTQAAANGVGELVIMRQTGHKSDSLRKYIRQGELFSQNGASQLGL
jgi:integrase